MVREARGNPGCDSQGPGEESWEGGVVSGGWVWLREHWVVPPLHPGPEDETLPALELLGDGGLRIR